MNLGLKLLICSLLPVLALLYVLLRGAQDPTINRPATPREQKHVTQMQTGWGKSFADHK
jgi:hypothetical protein